MFLAALRGISVITAVYFKLVHLQAIAGLDLDGQRVLEKARLDALVAGQKLADHSLVVKTVLDLALNVRVLHFLVLLNDVFDLADDALERPFSQLCCHTHVFLLDIQLHFLNVLHEV